MAMLSPEEKERRIRTNKKILKFFGLILVCLLLAGAFFSSKQSPEASAEQATSAPIQNPNPTPPTETQAPTTEQVRTEVAVLLNELDGFRNSSVFQQCKFGCGAENPAKAWNVRRKALQDKMNPQLDVPILLKVAPGDLWALGMAYAKGKDTEASELRAGIEKALQQ